MKHNFMLAIASLLSIILFTFHHADDVVRGMAPGGFSNLVPVIFLVLWLYGTTMVLNERQLGYVIILVLSLLGSGIPVLHMMGSGLVGGKIADSSGAFFFVWTLIALSVTTLFSVILSARALWSLRRGKLQVVQESEH
jgi:hypothetical protein